MKHAGSRFDIALRHYEIKIIPCPFKRRVCQDLISILPSYLSLFLPGAHHLLVICVLRVLRVFRALKLDRFINQANLLVNALLASRLKIAIFMFTISTLPTGIFTAELSKEMKKTGQGGWTSMFTVPASRL